MKVFAEWDASDLVNQGWAEEFSTDALECIADFIDMAYPDGVKESWLNDYLRFDCYEYDPKDFIHEYDYLLERDEDQDDDEYLEALVQEVSDSTQPTSLLDSGNVLRY